MSWERAECGLPATTNTCRKWATRLWKHGCVLKVTVKSIDIEGNRGEKWRVDSNHGLAGPLMVRRGERGQGSAEARAGFRSDDFEC